MSRKATLTVEEELLNLMGQANRLCEYLRKARDFVPVGEFAARLANLENAVARAEASTGFHATDEG